MLATVCPAKNRAREPLRDNFRVARPGVAEITTLGVLSTFHFFCFVNSTLMLLVAAAGVRVLTTPLLCVAITIVLIFWKWERPVQS